MTTEDEQERLDGIHNERTKLLATWFNNVGVGCVIAGGIAQAVTLTLRDAPITVWAISGSLIWIPVGIALHYFGRRVLGALR